MNRWQDWFFDPRLLLISGILLGIGLGLVFGWLVWPVSYYDTDLYDLRPDYQDDFVVMVAALYDLDHDLAAARRTLAQLSDPQAPQTVEAIVVNVTERHIAQGADPADVRRLVQLAAALDSVTTPMQPYLDKGGL